MDKIYQTALDEMKNKINDLKVIAEVQLKDISIEQREILEQCFTLLTKLNTEIESYKLFVTLLNFGAKNNDKTQGESLDDFTLTN